jgi:radical SAM protein with 4Fe4S-binding SPASM domain
VNVLPSAAPEPPTSLRHVVWELTLACDLACGHCGSRAAKKREGELSTEEALDVVQQVAEMGAREVSLIGGEAYLRDDWTQIARAIVDAGMICSMVSGGRGFDERRAKQARDAGVDSVSLSVDGIGATHDVQRGVDGSFARVVQAFEHLVRAGVPVSANSQLNRLSFPDLDAMLDLFLGFGAHGWQLAMTVPMGRAQEHPDWLFQPEDLLLVFPKLAELSERGRANGLRLFPGNNVGYFGPHEQRLRGVAAAEGQMAYFQGCQAGVAGMGIEADGAIKGCPSLPTVGYTGGHVRTEPIRTIWERASELTFNRVDRASETWGFCGTCYYRSVCKGGCSWTAHVFFGKRGNNPYCHHRALTMRERGLTERLVMVSPGDGAPFDHGLWEIVVEPARPELPTIDPWEPSRPRARRALKVLG